MDRMAQPVKISSPNTRVIRYWDVLCRSLLKKFFYKLRRHKFQINNINFNESKQIGRLLNEAHRVGLVISIEQCRVFRRSGIQNLNHPRKDDNWRKRVRKDKRSNVAGQRHFSKFNFHTEALPPENSIRPSKGGPKKRL